MMELCRGCLQLKKDMKSLYATIKGDSLKFGDLIKKCTGITIDQEDHLPQMICSECESSLVSAYQFIVMFTENDQAINSNKGLSKLEEYEIETEEIIIETANELKPASEFLCLNCNMCFENQHSYEMHQENNCLLVDNLHTSNADKSTEKQQLSEGSESLVKRSLQCTDCFKVLSTEEGLKMHMKRHKGNNLHACKQCGKHFVKMYHLKRHMSSVHNIDLEIEETTTVQKKVYKCKFCVKKFKYKKSYQQHQIAEHDLEDSASDFDSESEKNTDEAKNPLPFQCHVCKHFFARENHLTRHLVVHRDILIHKCDQCEKSFASTDALDKHKKVDHTRSYCCLKCDHFFERGEQLIAHLKSHTEEIPSPVCSVCEEEFTSLDLLIAHIKIHMLEDNKKHVCKFCGKAFVRANNMRTHERTHFEIKEPSKLHLCIYCGKEFNNSSNMIVHMRRHTGERPYKCSVCDKGFPRSHDLKCHERIHSGEKPYLCTLCGKSFNKSNKLLRHTRVHTGERPYVCNICGKAFTQSNDLTLHMRRHTGARPYICGVCPARFIQSGQLKAHRRSTGHIKEVEPELKGAHRVEPVAGVTPVPIRFKKHGKNKSNDNLDEVIIEKETNMENLELKPNVIIERNYMEDDFPPQDPLEEMNADVKPVFIAGVNYN